MRALEQLTRLTIQNLLALPLKPDSALRDYLVQNFETALDDMRKCPANAAAARTKLKSASEAVIRLLRLIRYLSADFVH
jgi:hypothetical protein